MAPDKDAPAAAPSVADLAPIIRAFAWKFCQASNGRLDIRDMTQAGLLAAHASLLAGAAYPAESRRTHAIARSRWAMLDHMRVEVRHNQRMHPEPLEVHIEPPFDEALDFRTPEPLVDRNDPERIATRREIARVTAEAIDNLSARQRDALAGLYGAEDGAAGTQALAQDWGVDDSRVRQVRAQALQTLRELLGVERPVTRAAAAAAGRAIAAAAA